LKEAAITSNAEEPSAQTYALVERLFAAAIDTLEMHPYTSEAGWASTER
jgi:hypothetical protein